ncbi:required for meiotic nuclear division protein 1 homolog [Episyrphus balteatus]|uniref:required for meiotic nuclear division protein 1 homolog n=1 Tax=Episyrphus balteatus TaxID=286459 RepID=UPI002485CA23|nr:required for meiotic nuclear division protein 1 homolog [Episyrphus balteatus]
MNFTRALFTKGFAVIAQTTGRRGFLSVAVPANKSTYLNNKQVLSIPKNLQLCRRVHENSVPLQIKKRITRKKRNEEEDIAAQGFFNVTAFSTAEQYDLESLVVGLEEQNLYAAKKFFSTDNLGAEQDVLYVTAKYMVNGEARDIFFFREGSVVMWNFNELEANNVLSFLKPYEKDGYLKPLVKGESEIMPYSYIPIPVEENVPLSSTQAMFKNGKFFLSKGEQTFLEKYTFSNAMATSIKLGIWEATLERFIDNMQYLTEDLKKGRRIKIDRAEALRLTGELFALRHMINLSSDLLDTPDFYWDREELETLYIQVCSYFSITRRTKVMNEKINHCVELAELISHNLNDKHHIRLEWMIIILIMVEVGFEILHHMENHYYINEQETTVVPVAH